MWPRYLIFSWNSEHFDGFTFNPRLPSLVRTSSNLCTVSSNVDPYTNTSSMNVRRVRKFWSPKAASIRRTKVAGALQRPNGILVYSYKHPVPIRKAVLYISSSAIGTWWYPWAKSRLTKNLAPPRASNASSMRGRVYASLLVFALSSL